MIFPDNLLTGTKQPQTKYNYMYNQEQKNLNNKTRKPLTYQQTKPMDTKAWFRDLVHHSARKRIKPILQFPGLWCIPFHTTIPLCGVTRCSGARFTKNLTPDLWQRIT